jgi:PIN domain nuclease of toxin-antitoxin system
VKLLIDTHALVWWWGDPGKLSERAEAILRDTNNTVAVSSAVAWEMAIKVKLGRLQALALVTNLPKVLQEKGFSAYPITIENAVRAGLLPLHHRDPFDRMLVAQAQSLNAPVLSADTALDKYDVVRIW